MNNTDETLDLIRYTYHEATGKDLSFEDAETISILTDEEIYNDYFLPNCI